MRNYDYFEIIFSTFQCIMQYAPNVLYNGLSLSDSFKQQRELTTFKDWQKREHKTSKFSFLKTIFTDY